MGIGERVFFVLQPSNALALLFALGVLLLLMRRRRAGTALLAGAALVFLALGFLPVGKAALRVLEARAVAGAIEAPPDGIIILGGAHPRASAMPGEFNVPLNAYAERLTAGAGLAHRYETARVILTDGGSPVPAAALSARLIASLGIAEERLVVEDRALSTFDNAVLTRDLVKPAPGERYVLITSAWHMPRSLATFRAAGWTGLVAFPVDGVTDDRPAWRSWNGSAARGLTFADLAAREYLALVYYWLKGRIDTPLPGGAQPPA